MYKYHKVSGVIKVVSLFLSLPTPPAELIKELEVIFSKFY